MWRTTLIALSTYALANANLSSSRILEGIAYPAIGFMLIIFFMFEFVVFLRSSGLDLMREVKQDFGDIYSNFLDFIIVVVDDRVEKYRGSFNILGCFEDVAEDFGGYFEVVCTVYGFFMYSK